ncbi:MAG: citrate (Si)-synthase [Rhabdochlamydiaceae bacterium]|nr:citrate (Si)-synthase [Candidatus Amphrikana amoebophyrae]
MSDIIFEVTEENLETGLRGYPVGYCITSKADPHKGLHYREIPVTDLVDTPPEEVMYLLYSGERDTGPKFKEFQKKLKSQCQLSSAMTKHIHSLPRHGHPMKLFAAAILILGMLESTGDYEKDGINLIAKMPHLAATVINHHAGWGDTPNPDANSTYIENFVNMLNVPGKDKHVLLETMSLFNILHMDHGGGNLSAFIAKAISSGHEDMFGSISGAMNALEGPLHGKANENGLKFVREMMEAVGENGTIEEIMTQTQKLLDAKELIYGFGHAVLRVEDPRATIFYDFGKKHFPEFNLVKTALKMRQGCVDTLKKNPKISNPYPNVDAISGSILSASGFAYPEYFTILFGLSRTVGLVTQIVYDRTIARGGKGTPIVRPKYIYVPASELLNMQSKKAG